MNPLSVQMFALIAPAISAILVLVIIVMDMINEGRYRLPTKLKLTLYLICVGLSWVQSFVYFYSPVIFIHLNALFYLAFILTPVLLYSFIFEITKTRPDEQFSWLHYVLPFIISATLLIISSTEPLEEQLLTVAGKGKYIGGSYLFFVISKSRFAVRIILSLTYAYLGFQRIPRYRRYVEGITPKKIKSRVRWVIIYLVFVLYPLPVLIFGVFFSRQIIFQSYTLILHAGLIMLQMAFWAFHIVKGNYDIISDADVQTNTLKPEGSENKHLTREIFETYMFSKKPYLNPDLKITDLVKSMAINRTYISTFINKEYRMNFNSFINHCRKMEFEQLQKLDKNKAFSRDELAERAGFNSYRSYQRFVSNSQNESDFNPVINLNNQKNQHK